MEAVQQDVTATVTDPIDAAIAALEDAKPETEQQPEPEQTGPTAKQMAAAEEINAARQAALTAQRQQEPAPEPPTLIEVAAQGMDALHEALRQNANRPVPEYVPPPRTERQMTALEEELEAGRRRVAQNEEHNRVAAEWRAKAAKEERAKEGFTTPVHRPADVVPDPMISSSSGSVAGSRLFGSK